MFSFFKKNKNKAEEAEQPLDEVANIEASPVLPEQEKTQEFALEILEQAPVLADEQATEELKENSPEVAKEVEPKRTPAIETPDPEVETPQEPAPQQAATPQELEVVIEQESTIEEPASPIAPQETIIVGQEQDQPQEPTEESDGWFSRLKTGLSKSSGKIGSGITDIFTKRKLDDDTLEELEELLIMADIGAKNAALITANIAKSRYDKEISELEIKEALADEIASILTPVTQPLSVNTGNSPHVIMMVGVNGNGKTTTIGKLAKQFGEQGKSVMLCAADTFRAAAVEQLQVWGERNNVPVVTGAHEADAASVAYTALERAKAEGKDLLMIDTAGRLQNKANLMAELEKIIRVIRKIDENAPHSIVLTLDATTGQNAISQAKTFREMVGVNGLIVTKLDGSAKAGVVVALAEQFGLPIHAIGVGEKIDDLRPFEAQDFARNLVGL